MYKRAFVACRWERILCSQFCAVAICIAGSLSLLMLPRSSFAALPAAKHVERGSAQKKYLYAQSGIARGFAHGRDGTFFLKVYF